jgi:hypothetical protein
VPRSPQNRKQKISRNITKEKRGPHSSATSYDGFNAALMTRKEKLKVGVHRPIPDIRTCGLSCNGSGWHLSWYCTV